MNYRYEEYNDDMQHEKMFTHLSDNESSIAHGVTTEAIFNKDVNRNKFLFVNTIIDLAVKKLQNIRHVPEHNISNILSEAIVDILEE